jgi:uncharacterized protein YjbI with pentapeptide repeats
MHLFVLVQLGLLAQTWRDLDARLSVSGMAPDQRPYILILDRLDTFVATQWLAGRRQTWVLRSLIVLAVWITLVLGPIAVLLTFQLRLLPYHDEGIIAWQRLVLLSDLIVLWLMWPAIHNRRSKGLHTLTRRTWRTANFVAASLASIGVLGFAFLVATVPGEKDTPEAPLGQWWVPRWFPTKQLKPGDSVYGTTAKCLPAKGVAGGFGPAPISCLLVPTTWITEVVTENRRIWLPTAILFEGVDDVSGQAKSPFLRNILAPDQKFVAGVRMATETSEQSARQETAEAFDSGANLSLRGRDLRYAMLARSDLHGVDFVNADLRGANLTRANLKDAKFNCLENDAGDPEPSSCANLEDANLSRAEMQGTNFWGAKLQRVFLDRSKLQGANLERAQLQGADFSYAVLQGANLEKADLTGSVYTSLDLFGVDFSGVQESALSEMRDVLKSQMQGVSASLGSAERKTARLIDLACESRDAHSVAAGILSWTHSPAATWAFGNNVGKRDAAERRILCSLRRSECFGTSGISVLLRDQRLLTQVSSSSTTDKDCAALEREQTAADRISNWLAPGGQPNDDRAKLLRKRMNPQGLDDESISSFLHTPAFEAAREKAIVDLKMP